MRTLAKNRFIFSQVKIPEIPLAKSLRFDNEMMHIFLTDGRIVSVPLIWFPLLHQATPKQREKYEISGGGTGLHWPQLDEDISVPVLLGGKCI